MYTGTAFDFVYQYGGRESHVLPRGLPIPLCGIKPNALIGSFFGTRNVAERNKANSLPKCPTCVDANNQLGEMSYNLNRGI